MSRSIIFAACAAIFTTWTGIPAAAQNPVQIATFQSWHTFIMSDRSSCGARARADISTHAARASAVLTVISTPAQNITNNIIYQAGYTFGTPSYLTLQVEGGLYALPIPRRTTLGIFTDSNIVELLRKGSQVVFRGPAVDGPIDASATFYLAGFSEALDRAMRECGLLPPAATSSIVPSMGGCRREVGRN